MEDLVAEHTGLRLLHLRCPAGAQRCHLFFGTGECAVGFPMGVFTLAGISFKKNYILLIML